MKVADEKFDEKFDELVQKKRELKNIKKDRFKSNIKGHTVVLDEYGNVIRQDSSLKKNVRSNKHLSFLLFLLGVAVLLLICFVLIFPDDYWFLYDIVKSL